MTDAHQAALSVATDLTEQLALERQETLSMLHYAAHGDADILARIVALEREFARLDEAARLDLEELIESAVVPSTSARP